MLLLNDISARYHFIQAVYDWCLEQEYTPYLLVNWDKDDGGDPILESYVVGGRVILNISPLAVKEIDINPDFIGFQARFSGKIVNITIQHQDIVAIYSKETQQFISFGNEDGHVDEPEKLKDSKPSQSSQKAKTSKPKTPSIRIV